jgi:hypothetical protein
VNEIEVNIPIYSEPDDYELLVISNFSQKSLNEDIIDGSLYVEFAKHPRSFYDFNFPFNLLKLSIPDEGYVRSASCILHKISTFEYFQK